MNWKARFGNLPVEERRTDEERWITEESLHGFAYGNISEALRKHLGLDFLHGKIFFLTQNSWNTSPGGSGILRTASLQPIYRKKGEEVAAQLAQARSNPAPKTHSGRPNSKFRNCYLHPPFLISSPPFFRNLRKSYGSLTEAYRTWFSSFFSLPSHPY